MVAFLARIDGFKGSSTLTDVPFDIVDLNLGNAYDPETGEFTAPVSGIYEISYEVLTGETCYNGYIKCNLNLGSISTISSSLGKYLHSGGTSLTLQREAGEKVSIDFIGYEGCESLAVGASNNKFSGHLVYMIEQ